MFLDNYHFYQIMTRIIPLINTRRAKSARQYPESQKCQTIPGEPKAPDNTRRAKSARQYLESQKCQTIPGEPKAPDNAWRANYFLFFLKIAF